MTPASPLSRLEKLADEKYRYQIPARDGLKATCNSCWKQEQSAFLEGGKALLQILSEPGEACGPRLFVEFSILYPDTVVDAWVKITQGERARSVEYVPLTELLQAGAAHEETKRQLEIADGNGADSERNWEETVEDFDELQAKLASSEARVRILSSALEKIARPHPQQREPDLEYYRALATQRRKCAAEALLEVQR